jgi:alpha-N-arabinofuranosidase
MEFTPQNEHEYAGLTLLQNNNFYYLFAVTKRDELIIQLIKRAHGKEEILIEQPVSSGQLLLKVEAHAQDYNFYVAQAQEGWRAIAEHVDGRILSTPVAGGFVGAYMAMVASSNGQPSTSHADFDWFEYVGLDP